MSIATTTQGAINFQGAEQLGCPVELGVRALVRERSFRSQRICGGSHQDERRIVKFGDRVGENGPIFEL